MIILIALISIVFGAYITSCPYTINSDGTYYLANNLVSSGNCIIVNTQNVVINGQGYSITSSGSGHGIFINVSSFNISIVNVNISSNQNIIYREGSVENSIITIYNSTLISNGTNLLVRNQSHSVNNLSIEILNSTLNSSGYRNIYFTINTSSNNTIRIVNSSLYANRSNIVPNDYLNGSVENLVVEIVESNLNASNERNIVSFVNTLSSNTIRIVNSTLNASNSQNVYFSTNTFSNNTIRIVNSTLNASNSQNVYFSTNTFSNNTIRIVNSSMYANQSNIVPNDYLNGSVENLVVEIVDSTLNSSENRNIYFKINTSSNNTIRIVNSSLYANRSNIVPNDYLNGSVENLVVEIVESNLNASNERNIVSFVNTLSSNTIRIVNSTLNASNSQNVYFSTNTFSNNTIRIVNSTLNASNSQNVYFSTNTFSNNTIRIVNSSMYANQSNIVPNDYLNGSVENLVIEIVDSTLNSSENRNIYFKINTSSNNTIRIVNSSLYANRSNIVPNDYLNGSVENLVVEIVESNLNASNERNIVSFVNTLSSNTIRIVNSTLNASNSQNVYFSTNISSNNTIRIVNSSMYANQSNIVPNDYLNGSVENLVIEILNSTLNSSGYRNIYFTINTSSNNTIRIVNSSMHANRSNIIPNSNLNGFVENLVLEILDSTLNASNERNIVSFVNTLSSNTIRIVNSTLNASNSQNVYFSTNISSNNTIRIVNSSMYANQSNIVPNDYLNGSVENLVIEIVDSTLNSSENRNIYFKINTSSNNTIRIVNSSLYANRSNIVPNDYLNGSVENLVVEIVESNLNASNERNIVSFVNTLSSNTIRIVNSTLNASNSQNVYFSTNTFSNNTIRIVNSSMYANQSNIVPNDYLNGSVENLVVEIVDSTLNSSSSSNLVINNNESKNTFIKINNSRLLAYGHIIQYRNNFNYNNHLKILNSELRGTIYSNIKFGPEISLSTNINNSVEIFNSTILTLLGTNIFYANGTNIGNNITITLSRIYSFGHAVDITHSNNIYFLSDSVNLNNIVQINDSILENKYTNIRFNDSNSSTNRNNTVIILRSNLSANDTNFLLYSLNKTLNDYNVLILNTSLIGNVSFNLTESTLNLYGFNNLFLSDQHFVNSSSNISGILNISKTLGTSIIGTPYLGGNYWKGYSDLCPDFDGDGLCELPYVISSNAIDYLPLTNHTEHGIVLSGNFSTNAIPLFNISINVSPSIDYTIYLYINGTLYNSTSGSGVGNYSLGATLGSGNYTYWFVVNYTIGGFNYSYTYGNYSAYVDIELPSILILWPVDGESYTRGNRIIQILVIDDLSSTLSCQLNVTGPDSFNHAFTISNGHVYNYSYNFDSLGLYTMNVSCNDGFNQNQTSIAFRIRESGGGSSDTTNGSNSDLNQSNNTLSDTVNNSNMNDTNQSIENNTTMNSNDNNGIDESDNVNNQGQSNEPRIRSRTQQSDYLEQLQNQTIQQNESLNEIKEENILNQTEEEQKPSSEEPVKDTEESKNISQQDLISRINNYISIGLSEMIKLNSPFPYLLLGSIILLLSRTIKLKIIPLQDRVILQFNNILNRPIKNLKVNIDGQELVTDENGQIILSSMPKQIKPKLYILVKL